MMRRLLFLSPLLYGLWLSPFQLAAQTEIFTEAENNRHAFKSVEKPVTVQFFETRLSDVLTELTDQTGMTFWVHDSAREYNLDEDTLISFAVEDTRLATVLTFMLEPYQCAFTIKDGVFRIVSMEAQSDELNLQVFDCREILKHIQPKTVKRYTDGRDLPRRPEKRRDPFGGRGGGVFAIPSAIVQEKTADKIDEALAEQAEQVQQAKPKSGAQDVEGQDVEEPDAGRAPFYYEELSGAEQLIELIVNTMDPYSWEINGGAARIREINGVVVIRQTCNNIREIRELLDRLETALAQK